MSRQYQIIFRSRNNESEVTEDIIFEGTASAPTDCHDFGIRHKDQIELISRAQSKILALQSSEIPLVQQCSACGSDQLRKIGTKASWFHDVFSDHKVRMQCMECKACGHVEAGTVLKMMGSSLSGELIKLQSEIGAKYSFRAVEELLDMMSHAPRKINNHTRVQDCADVVGDTIRILQAEEKILATTEAASELIIQVDGGHVNSADDSRSFEAMAAVVYKPDAVQPDPHDKSRTIVSSKHCAASAKSDNQFEMKQSTIIAAIKEGLSPETNLIALCDGATNCWNIVNAVSALAKSTTKILDWFHISMKWGNIAIPYPEQSCIFYVVDDKSKLVSDGIYKLNTAYYQVYNGEVDDLTIHSNNPDMDVTKLKNNQMIRWDALEKYFNGCVTTKTKYESVKWYLWHGDPGKAIERLNNIIFQTDKQTATKLTKFRQYIENNIEMIVNYQERLDNNQIFTSSFAESTVESLINQRCKGKKHMRWTREGLNNILQIRAAIASNSWNNIWKMVVRNSIANTTIN